MNLVHLLLRSARWLPERPALATGRRVVRSYGEMASRVAKTRFRFHKKAFIEARRSGSPGDAQLPRVLRDPVRLLARRPHRGADERQAPPEGIRLHPGELGREGLLRHARPRERGAGEHSDQGHRVIAWGTGRSGGDETRRRGMALLYEWHDRRAEGGDAHAPQHALPDAGLLRRHRQARPAGRRAARGAAVARLGALRAAALRGRRRERDARKAGTSSPPRSSTSRITGRTSRSSPRRP